MNMRAEEFIQLDEADWKQKLAGAAMAGSLALGSTSTATQAELPAPKVDPAEQLVLAQTMWGEARNDGIEGMRAVGHVIMNRIDSSQANFGSDVESVAKKRKQFSVWNPGDPNRSKMINIVNDKDNPEYKSFSQAYELAGKILSGRDKDNTGGAIMYHTASITPYWSANIEPTKKISSHVFYDKFPRT